MNQFCKYTLLFALPLLLATSIQAATIPTKVTAEGMTYDAKKNAVVFEKEVHVEREGFQLWADRITLHLKPATAKPGAEADADPMNAMQSGDVDRIVAEDNVRMKYNKQSGQADKATYFADKALLLMEGNPILREGENTLKGSSIRYYLNENRSEVQGGPKNRVEAVFTTGDIKLGDQKTEAAPQPAAPKKGK